MCLCVKHTDTSAALLDSDVSKKARRRKKANKSPELYQALLHALPVFYLGFTFYF